MERVLFAPRELAALRPDVAQDPDPYSDWVRRREADRVGAMAGVESAEPLHLVMPIAGEPPPETVDTLRSLQAQTTERWVLTALVENRLHATFMSLLAVSGLQRAQRVRLDGDGGSDQLCDVLRSGLGALAGSNVALIFPGDVWAPDAVAQLAARLVPGGVVYADEDTVTADRRHTEPRLKPSYSPDFLLTSPYLGRPLAFGSLVLDRLLAQGVAPTRAIEHDLALRVCDAADSVVHLPEVLCHRLKGADDEPDVADPLPVAASLLRRGEAAEVRPGPVPGTFSIRRSRRAERRVSIIIPFRDEPAMLRTCVDSIDATRGSSPLECILVDNGSTQPETATLVEQLAGRPDVRVRHDGRPFNWAELNNAAAEVASGDVLLFLNNDIEARHAGWIDVLCDQAMRPDVGVVGARLLYPSHRVQHCGVVLGLGGAAGHHLVGLAAEAPGYLNMAVLARECAAVTGACLATRRDVFGRLGGFDESLGVDLNDIDYCLRAQRAGLRVLFDPDVELIHYESPSRGTAGDVKDIVRFVDRWRDSIVAGDPYLHPQLTRMDASCALRAPHETQWWLQWAASLEGPR